jgi:hypothetical protein
MGQFRMRDCPYNSRWAPSGSSRSHAADGEALNGGLTTGGFGVLPKCAFHHPLNVDAALALPWRCYGENFFQTDKPNYG